MDSLSDALAEIERRRKTLEVYTDDEAIAAEVTTQFSTRNVDVVGHPAPPGDEPGFVVIRDANDQFRGAVGIDDLEAILSPDVHPPWRLEDAAERTAELFDFLDNTIFTAYDRRQMLAATREIEERAWRVDAGTLYVGFQHAAAFAAQLPVYERFGSDRAVTVRIFIEDEWDGDVPSGVDVVENAGDELGRFWLVVFDGGTSDLHACGLLAEERDDDRYFGFWTYDPARVDELVSYLEGIRDRE